MLDYSTLAVDVNVSWLIDWQPLQSVFCFSACDSRDIQPKDNFLNALQIK